MGSRAIKQIFENSNIAKEYGFSLLETLIALAILSLTSLILFQSTSSMLSVSEKASTASERLIESVIARKTFQNIINGLTPGWQNEESTVFRGTPNEFSGLTTSFPAIIDHRLVRFNVTLSQASNAKNTLIIKSTETDEIILEEFSAELASFEYMGDDQHFYPIWPPQELQEQGFAVDAEFREIPSLPKLIRLKVLTSSSEQNADTIWIASIGGETKLPYKDDISSENYDF
jgi:prepilin-type N-terminal cleavage/methylation domain-containing protein